MVGRYEVYVLFDSITVTTDNGDKGLLMDCLDYAVLPVSYTHLTLPTILRV